MLKLATLIQNPGEPPVDSRYRDPNELKRLGYNGLVLYESTALSGLPDPSAVQSADLSLWVSQLADQIESQINAAVQAGLDVYLSYDAYAFPEDIVSDDVLGICCSRRPTVICPSSRQAVKRSVEALDAWLKRWPQVSGVVLRFGDHDAGRVPYLVGNDVYSPRCEKCRDLGQVQRVLNLVEPMHDLVVKQLDKQLILRAWNISSGGMHDSPKLAQELAECLPGDPADKRLVLSFKCTETDFWRYQPWNRASLSCGKRPILYELQCQREFEGKGGVANWQAPLWQSGQPEVTAAQGDDDVDVAAADQQDQDENVAGQMQAASGAVTGLAQAAEQVRLAGLWAWVRGGGWGGPFVRDESWIDANVYAVPKLADNPAVDLQTVAKDWIRQRLGCEEPPLIQALLDLLNDSPRFILEAFYIGPFAAMRPSAWHPNAGWIKDDLLDAVTARRMIDRLPEATLSQAVAEKRRAADAIGKHRAKLQHLLGDHHAPHLEPLVNTMLYAESLADTMRGLIEGLVAYRRYRFTGQRSDAEQVRRAFLSAQSHWNHHTQRFSTLAGAATAFREHQFWELTQDLLAEVM